MLRSLAIDALSGIGCCVGLAILLSLGGCGGNSGADTQTRPDTTVPQNNQYTGPAPATDDVQRFKLFVWDNLAPSNRCGQCHSETQAPLFVARADINQAYSEANAVTNLDNPSDSILVRKVAGGHNCWLDSDAACADTLSRYLEAWASESVGKEAVIELTPPPVLEIGSAKQFSDSNQGFADTVYPMLQNFCAQCHSRSAAIPQAPFFADPDIDIAYSEAQAKIDLTTPDNSRVVIRLRDEFHNCWSECEQNAAQLTAAISDLSETLPEITFDQTLLTSKALTLEHGILASSGGRYQENAVALYEFKTGEGTTVFDTSGVEPALNLTLSGDTEWVAGWGITLNGGKAQGSTLSSRKLQNSITATGEYSIETWLASATTTQEGPARIVSYSAGLNARNFTLGQLQQNYTFSLRHANTDANGAPALTTPDASTALQATLQHVVATYSPAYGRRIYVNGELVSDPDATIPGNLNDWDNTYAFVLGNEVSGNRPWQGTIRMLAIHNRALTPEQITTNFDAGVGQQFYLLFNSSHLHQESSQPSESYIVFKVSQFDNFSYLFSSPFFISLDPEFIPENIQLSGLRIGINGREQTVGQAFANLNVTLSPGEYSTERGQTLSSLGTIIPVDRGAEVDEFFITFDRYGDQQYVRLEPPAPPSPPPQTPTPKATIGIRTSNDINHSLATITGVPTTHPAVAATFATVQEQLPAQENIDGFLSSQQMAITQLAIAYCDALVEDSDLRTRFFPGFDFNQAVDGALDERGRTAVIDSLLEKVMPGELQSQPRTVDVQNELHDLLDRLIKCPGNCSTERTRTVVKSTCAAMLGSAVMLIQ